MSFLGWITGNQQPQAPVPTPQPRLSATANDEISRWENEFRTVINQNTVNKGNQVIGVNLGSSKQFQAEVEGVIRNLKGSYAQYKVELENNKKEKMMNRAFASNFKSNLEVMVDVTNLLHSYMALFQTLRDELQSFNNAIYKDASDPNSLDYLQELTSTHIKSLQNTFAVQSKLLQDYYTQHPELQNSAAMKENVASAEANINNVVSSAQVALANGGKSTRRRNNRKK